MFAVCVVVMRIAILLGCPPYMAGCLSATSYVTVVFYTRTFSNSLEALFFALVLVCVCEFLQYCRVSVVSRNDTQPHSLTPTEPHNSTITLKSSPATDGSLSTDTPANPNATCNSTETGAVAASCPAARTDDSLQNPSMEIPEVETGWCSCF